jgi:hypothetical protein
MAVGWPMKTSLLGVHGPSRTASIRGRFGVDGVFVWFWWCADGGRWEWAVAESCSEVFADLSEEASLQ